MPNISEEILENLTRGKAAVKNNALVILVGLPYSGKSTIAEKLSDFNFVHFWATKIKKQYGLNDEQLLKLSDEVIGNLLSSGYNVVFDFLNHKQKQREVISSIAEKLDKKYFIAFLDTPKELVLKRQAEVFESDGRSNISPKIIDEIEAELEIPSGENVAILKDGKSTNAFLDTIKMWSTAH